MDVGTIEAAERVVNTVDIAPEVLIAGSGAPAIKISAQQRDLLVRFAQDGIAAAYNTRKREVLLAEVLTVLNATDISPAIVDTVAERILTKLGVALLVDGDPTDTSTIRSGEKQTMTVEEFLRREGGGAG